MSLGVVITEPYAALPEPGYWSGGRAPVGVVPLLDALCLLPWVEEEKPSHLVVLARRPAASAAKEAVTVLTGHRPDLPVSLLVRDASALALAVAGGEGLAQGADPNHAVGLIDRALESTTSGAWVQRVRHLSAPRPSTLQRLRSLLPGRGFVVRLGFEPEVRSSVELTEPPLVAGEDGSAPVLKAVHALGGSATTAPPVLDARRAYGATAVEFVSVAPVDRTLQTYGLCPVCRTRVASAICTYCHVHARTEGHRS